MKKQGKKLLGLVLAAGLVVQPFAGVGWQNAGAQSTVAEAAVTVVNGTIRDIYTDKAMYQPGDTVQVTIETEHVAGGSVKLVPRHLDAAAGEPVVVNFSGTAPVTVNWTAPVTDFQGYLIEASMYDGEGTLVDTDSVGINVSSDWVKFPIYGYLHDFKENVDTAEKIAQMTKYHINGIEFYDWHHRHHEPFPSTSTSEDMGVWDDWSGRLIYGDTVKDYIRYAKERNMASMAYDMIYAFTDDLLDVMPEANNWRLKFAAGADQGQYFNYDMNPYEEKKNDTLYFVNPLNTEWQSFFFAQLQRMLEETGFDGFHGDTVGDWGDMTDNDGNPLGYDEDGNPISIVADTYTQFLNACKDAIGDSYLSFNPVGAKGIENVNVSKTSVLYTEFWPWDITRYGTSYSNYAAIAKEVEDSMNDSKAQSIDGKGKSLAVKAYINYHCSGGNVNDPAALVLESVAFAAGGNRLEIGNGEHMLTSEYYPSDNIPMSAALKAHVRDMYDFAVAYENILRDGQYRTANKVTVDGYKSSTNADANAIWTYTKADGEHEILHLINLLGSDNEWRDVERTKAVPYAVKNVPVKYYYTNDVNSVFLASPDVNDGRSGSLAFTKGEDADGKYVEFTVPSLEYWDMIYMTAEETEELVIENPITVEGDTTTIEAEAFDGGVNDTDGNVVYKTARADGTFSMEAEDGVLTPVNGNPVVEPDENASGGLYVHDISLDQGYLTMTVPEDITPGVYDMKVVYSSGMNGTVSITVGGKEYVTDYTKTNVWECFTGHTLVVRTEVNPGDEIVIHDAYGNCWIWIDYIECETPWEISYTLPEDFETGIYQLATRYVSDENGTIKVVAGEDENVLQWMSTGSLNWDAAGNMVLGNYILKAGDTIKITAPGGASHIQLDKFMLTKIGEDEPKDSFIVEAESAVLTPNGGNPVIGYDGQASCSEYIHDIGLKQGYATLKVPENIVPGVYNLDLRYSSGVSGKVSVTVDGNEKVLNYTATDPGWGFAPNTIRMWNVELSGGEEIVVHDAIDNCWIWLDYIAFNLSNGEEAPEEPTEPEETVTEPEETVTEPEETVTEPEETVTEPEETVTEPEETVTEPEETVTEPEETVTEPEETVTEPEEPSKPGLDNDDAAETGERSPLSYLLFLLIGAAGVGMSLKSGRKEDYTE